MEEAVLKASFPEKVVLYQSSEKFIQDFVKAAKSQNKTDFQNYYQMIDVLIIDDIQFLSGKAAFTSSPIACAKCVFPTP